MEKKIMTLKSANEGLLMKVEKLRADRADLENVVAELMGKMPPESLQLDESSNQQVDIVS